MSKLIGQWYGKLDGGSTGDVLVNIERDGGKIYGRALVYEPEPNVAFSMHFAFSENSDGAAATGNLELVFNAATRKLEHAANHDALVRELGIPKSANANFTVSVDGHSLLIAWTTEHGNSGSGTLRSYLAPPWSDKPQRLVSWDEYKSKLAGFERGGWIFRGQAAPWPLRTCFNRRGRYDLTRYAMDDVPAMHRVFVASTNQWLQTSDPLQHASLIALGQHHGYPTPLLDWTRSPYIAAYFAVREGAPHDSRGGPRIYAFHARKWRQSCYQTGDLTEPVPSITIVDSIPFWNVRAVQQQSITTFSNVDNIELYIAGQTGMADTLEWFDFDPHERERIIDELEWMGITEGLVFPGMEGSYKSLARGRFPA